MELHAWLVRSRAVVSTCYLGRLDLSKKHDAVSHSHVGVHAHFQSSDADRANLTGGEAAAAWGHDRLNTCDRQRADSFQPQPRTETISARPTRDAGTAFPSIMR